MNILMVCLGNICRSPMAEGILSKKAEMEGIDLQIDSSGTSTHHIGEHPDKRAIAQLQKAGIDISTLVARQFTQADFDRFDRILVMDEMNLENVLKLSRNERDESKVDMMLNMAYPGSNMSVPDPYFGGDGGFDEVHRLLDEACDALLRTIVHERQQEG